MKQKGIVNESHPYGDSGSKSEKWNFISYLLFKDATPNSFLNNKKLMDNIVTLASGILSQDCDSPKELNVIVNANALSVLGGTIFDKTGTSYFNLLKRLGVNFVTEKNFIKEGLNKLEEDDTLWKNINISKKDGLESVETLCNANFLKIVMRKDFLAALALATFGKSGDITVSVDSDVLFEHGFKLPSVAEFRLANPGSYYGVTYHSIYDALGNTRRATILDAVRERQLGRVSDQNLTASQVGDACSDFGTNYIRIPVHAAINSQGKQQIAMDKTLFFNTIQQESLVADACNMETRSQFVRWANKSIPMVKKTDNGVVVEGNFPTGDENEYFFTKRIQTATKEAKGSIYYKNPEAGALLGAEQIGILGRRIKGALPFREGLNYTTPLSQDAPLPLLGDIHTMRRDIGCGAMMFGSVPKMESNKSMLGELGRRALDNGLCGDKGFISRSYNLQHDMERSNEMALAIASMSQEQFDSIDPKNISGYLRSVANQHTRYPLPYKSFLNQNDLLASGSDFLDSGIQTFSYSTCKNVAQGLARDGIIHILQNFGGFSKQRAERIAGRAISASDIAESAIWAYIYPDPAKISAFVARITIPYIADKVKPGLGNKVTNSTIFQASMNFLRYSSEMMNSPARLAGGVAGAVLSSMVSKNIINTCSRATSFASKACGTVYNKLPSVRSINHTQHLSTQKPFSHAKQEEQNVGKITGSRVLHLL